MISIPVFGSRYNIKSEKRFLEYNLHIGEIIGRNLMILNNSLVMHCKTQPGNHEMLANE